jgi:phosphoglycerol transferase
MACKRSIALLILLVGLSSGCNQNAGTPAAVSNNAAPDPLAPRYEASLAEGIDFKKPGYPSFLAEVSGISGHENWGRWTDGPVVKFRFKRNLPNKFTLRLGSGAFGQNMNQPIIVRAGNVSRHFTVKDPMGKEIFTMNFEGVDGADILEIVPPKPTRPKDIDPKTTDERLLGLAMFSLKIQE